jgi:hypothetical protein
MKLDAGEKLRQVVVSGKEGILVRGKGNRDKPMERSMSLRELAGHAGTRGRKGTLLEPKWRDVVMAPARP